MNEADRKAADPSAMFSLEALMAIEPSLREHARTRLATAVPEGGSCVIDLDRMLGREAPRIAAPIERPPPKPAPIPVVPPERTRFALLATIALLGASFIVLATLALVRPTRVVIEHVPARDPSLSVYEMEAAINEARR